MRTVKFRDDVLWAVADKMGLDPEQSNFLTNQAIPIGKSIDQWVRRVWEARDWPEWTLLDEFIPVNHIVDYDYSGASLSDFSANPKTIGKPLKVYLVNPETTDAPVDTTFTLETRGIHCGHEHGTTVWIKYMPPAPRFTAVQWSSSATYSKGDVVYSYTTGECYKSKVDHNLNHDPASTFSVPPHQSTEPVTLPPPSVDITQERTPPSVGVPARNQILVLSMSDEFTGSTPTDPPELGTDFVVQVQDTATSILLASVLHTANGTESIADVVTNLVAQLIADPDLSAYTITAGATTITLEAPALFTCPLSSYTILSEGGPTHLMKQVITQTYFPGLSTASGQSQITQITLNAETTFPGAVYELTVIESNGTTHVIDYASNLYDGSEQILNGLILATEASTDTYWSSLVKTFDATNLTLDLSTNDEFATHISAQRPPPPGVHPPTVGGAYWELNPFPRAIVEAVVRGAYADLLKEWGQTDKGSAEEGVVPSETQISEGDFTPTPNPALTGQQRAMSRYRL